jgi:hypothetical protein
LSTVNTPNYSSYNLIGTGGSGGLGNGINGNIVFPEAIAPANIGLAIGLGPLQNNGGSTDTMALLPGSPAIDAGSVQLYDDILGSNASATDQRGASRFGVLPGGVPTIDIGAYENGVLSPLTFTVDAPTDNSFSGLPNALTLRQAVLLADFDPSERPVTINFDPTIFATPQTIQFTDGVIELNNTSAEVTIQGLEAPDGANLISVSGANASSLSPLQTPQQKPAPPDQGKLGTLKRRWNRVRSTS